MLDAQRAVQTLRARAKELNIDPQRIGAIGFSAGGHLCSTISTHFAELDPTSEDPIARVSSRPDFAILCYPVIVFDQPVTLKGKPTKLAGRESRTELIALLSNERQVTERTPPTFLFHTAEDTAVPVENSDRSTSSPAKNRACRRSCTSFRRDVMDWGWPRTHPALRSGLSYARMAAKDRCGDTVVLPFLVTIHAVDQTRTREQASANGVAAVDAVANRRPRDRASDGLSACFHKSAISSFLFHRFQRRIERLLESPRHAAVSCADFIGIRDF